MSSHERIFKRGPDLWVLIHGGWRCGRFVTSDFEGLIIYTLKLCLHLRGTIEGWYAKYHVNGMATKINGRIGDGSHLISFRQLEMPAIRLSREYAHSSIRCWAGHNSTVIATAL